MIVPQTFRDRLGDRIVIGVNMAQTSIAIYPFEVWQKKVDMLTELSDEDVSAEVFLERFAMFSFDNLGFDMQGRVLIPAALRELFLRDATGVQVSGAGTMCASSPASRQRMRSAHSARSTRMCAGYQPDSGEDTREPG